MMPHNRDLERHVIGAVLFDSDCFEPISAIIRKPDFYEPIYSDLWRAMAGLQAAGRAIDLVSLGSAVPRATDALLWVSSEVVSAANVRDHARQVRDLSQRRALIRTLTERLEAATSSDATTKALIEDTEAAVMSFGDASVEVNGLKDLRSILRDSAPEWQACATGQLMGLRTGITGLDDMLGGLRPGTLNVIAARPGVGKSVLTLQAAIQCGAPVALYSLEMMAIEQAERLITQRIEGIDTSAIRNGNVIKSRSADFMQAINEIKNCPLHICDNSSVTPAQMLAQCRRLKQKQGLGMIVVDYLQLVHTTEKFDSRVREVGSVSKFLKRMANDLGVPVVAVASMSRDCEKREDKRGMLSDLRESGEIESDAHTVTFLYRHSEYDKSVSENNELKNVTEAIVRKNRGGKKGTVLMSFDGARSKYYDMTPDAQKNYLNTIKGNTYDTQGNSGNTGKVSYPNGGQGARQTPRVRTSQAGFMGNAPERNA